MRRSTSIESPAASPALPYTYINTLSHKCYYFRKKAIEHKICVLIFSTTLSETLLILRLIWQDIIINKHGFSCKVLVIPGAF
jgi:hypothetical protein